MHFMYTTHLVVMWRDFEKNCSEKFQTIARINVILATPSVSLILAEQHFLLIKVLSS